MKSLVVLGLLIATVSLVVGVDFDFEESLEEEEPIEEEPIEEEPMEEEPFPDSTLEEHQFPNVDNGASLDVGKEITPVSDLDSPEAIKVVSDNGASLEMDKKITPEVAKALREIKDAFFPMDIYSPEVIKVVFDNGKSLDLGKEISPTESKNQPVVVDWKAEKGAYYTLIVANPDKPCRQQPYLKDLLNWLVVNIPGKNIEAGDVLAEYIGAAPPRNMGMNRYFYFIYKQPGKIKFDEKKIDKYTLERRYLFSVRKFAEKYNLGDPKGVNFLTAYFDSQAEALYKDQLKCCMEFYSSRSKPCESDTIDDYE